MIVLTKFMALWLFPAKQRFKMQAVKELDCKYMDENWKAYYRFCYIGRENLNTKLMVET